MEQIATITGLFIKADSGEPMRPVDVLQTVSERGIEGDRSFGRSSRQVLLVDHEVLHEFNLEPGDLRENITVRGLDIDLLEPNTELQVGSVRLRVNGACSPCSKLDELKPGLQSAIRGKRGILASVLEGGPISIGDKINPA